MIGPGAFHILAVLEAPPEIAAAYHDADLHAHIDALPHHFGDGFQHVEIDTPMAFGIPGQGFAADLEKHAFVFQCFHTIPRF